MEERILDDEELRKIKIKRTAEGTDAVDELSPDAEGEDVEDEIVLELPEGEYTDEGLVGLTPSQLQEELERRKRIMEEARVESAKLAEEGAEKLVAREFAAAEQAYGRALMLDGENDAAREGLWTARSLGFTDDNIFYNEEAAAELAEDERAKAFVLEHVGERLRTAREEFAREEEELRPSVEENVEKRRAAFSANRKYWLVRFGFSFAALVLFGIAIGVSGSFLLSTLTNTPVICMGIFGGLAFVALVLSILFGRKLFLASQLCRMNENLSSTESGARLAFLQESLRALKSVLGE